MHHEKLTATIKELEQQLRKLDTLDQESRASLLRTVETIRDAVENEEQTGKLPSKSVVSDLTKSVERFEAEHPTLTGLLGQLADMLGQMGI